ncbi:MAG TPA: hypothetical protein VLF19_06485, partial [Methylomirabilota bacterium]|nr:hypothetical protein [Methylomirabilota bacterium]
MPGLEEVLEAHGPVATQERDFEFLLRDMLQHRRLVGDPSNALDAEPLPAPASDRPTVLVVDDDATLLATLADMLGRAFRV